MNEKILWELFKKTGDIKYYNLLMQIKNRLLPIFFILKISVMSEFFYLTVIHHIIAVFMLGGRKFISFV